MTTPTLIRRLLYSLAWLAPTWALVALATGGLGWMIGPLWLSSRQPVRPLLLGLAVAIYCAWRFSQAELDAEARLFEKWLRRVSTVIPALAVLAAGIIGFHYGSFAAAGADSYGYVSQAGLWLSGTLRIAQPWVEQMSWSNRGFAFAPLGYRPLSPESSTIVPTYPPGLPLLMAGFQAVFGANGPFFVVPIIGMLGVWFTYLLGREATGSKAVGIGATALLITSPVFLGYLMLPMTDVPVGVAWTLVCMLAIKTPRPRPLLAGLAAGAAVLIRPNLLPLTLAPLAAWISPWVRKRQCLAPTLRHALWFGLGLLPAVLGVAILNASLYGSPLVSGYGSLGDIYFFSAAPENLRNYGRWLIQAQSPLILFSLIPLLSPRALREQENIASARVCLAVLIVLILVSYIFYNRFTQWQYLRFLLPAFPALFVLMTEGIRRTCLLLPRPVRAPAGALILLTAAVFGFRFARNEYLFDQRSFEQRYLRAARYVDRLTPANSVVLAWQHSGSIRFYAHRITLRYDWLDKDSLDATLRELKEKGYRPYIVVDDWEEVEFRKRFGEASHAGRLDWQPIARVVGNPEVRLFDPEGRTASR